MTALTGIVFEAPSPKAATVSDVVAGDRLKDLGRKGRYWRVGFPDGGPPGGGPPGGGAAGCGSDDTNNIGYQYGIA